MAYYLVKQWQPHRGQTSEEPSCYFCGAYTYSHPLAEVKREGCYKSRKRAQRTADKWASIWSRTEVIEVPEDVIID